MGESIDVWREFFRTTDTDVFEFIEKAITIATLDCPKDFLSRRDRIAKRLFSGEMTGAGVYCRLASKESEANSNTGNVARDVVSMNYSHAEAETFSEIEETSQVVGQVLRIKRVLDNSRHESDSELNKALIGLQSMSITVDILEKTKIGVSVNILRRNCGSKQIAQLAHNITTGWKAMVEEICHRTVDVADPSNVEDGKTSSDKNQNIREPQQEKYDFNKASSLVKRNQRLNVNQHKGIVKANVSSNTNSRTNPASQNIRELRQETYDFNKASSLVKRNQRLNVNQHKCIVKPSMSSNTNSRTNPASQNIREPRQEKYDFNKAGSLAKRNQRLNVNRHKCIVKPDMSSNTNSRTNTASKVAPWNFEKERMLQSQDSNGSVAGSKTPLANRHDIIKGWNEVVADMKFGSTKRKMQELYQKAETDKRRRTVQVLDPCNLPKMAESHKAPFATTAKAHRRRVISQSRVSCV